MARRAIPELEDEAVPMTQRYSWSWGDTVDTVVGEGGVVGVVKPVPSEYINIRDHRLATTIAIVASVDVAERIVNALNGVANGHDR